MDIESRVSAGAKWLDEYKPNWYKLVDISKLNMQDVNVCIAGQVFKEEGDRVSDDGFGYVLGILNDLNVDSFDYGFDSEMNGGVPHWIEEIEERRARPPSREDLKTLIESKRSELAGLERMLEEMPKIRYFTLYHSTKANNTFNPRVVRGNSDYSIYKGQMVTYDSIEAARESMSFTDDMDSWIYTIFSIDENSHIEIVERG